MKPHHLITFILLLAATWHLQAQNNTLPQPQWQTIIQKSDNMSLNAVEEEQIFGGELYILTTFYFPNPDGSFGVRGLMRWNGKRWDTVGNTPNIISIGTYKSDLYATIDCNDSNGLPDNDFNANYLAKWNGEKWDSIGGLIDGDVSKLIEYQDCIYGELNDDKKNSASIVKWNRIRWDTILTMKSDNSIPGCFAIYKGHLYFGCANISNSASINSPLLSWDGKHWDSAKYIDIRSVYSLQVFNNKLYVGADFNDDRFKGIASWDEKKWDNVGPGFNSKYSPFISSMAIYNNELYVGGEFNTIDNKPTKQSIAKWNGKEWAPVKGPGGDLFAYNGDLYSSGNFNKWNGKTFYNLAIYSTHLQTRSTKAIRSPFMQTNIKHKAEKENFSAYSVTDDSIKDYFIDYIFKYNGELYVAGINKYFHKYRSTRWGKHSSFHVGKEFAENQKLERYFSRHDYTTPRRYRSYSDFEFLRQVCHLYKWNDKYWQRIAEGDTNYSTINCTCIYNNKLYVAGSFKSINGIKANNIACWDGKQWQACDSGVHDEINSMAVYNNRLYVAGAMNCWDEKKWTSPLHLKKCNGTITTLCTYHDKLYIGGYFDTINKVARRIAIWNDTTLTTTGQGFTQDETRMQPPCRVTTMAAYKGLLYIAGVYDHFNGKEIFGFATWNGKTAKPQLPADRYYNYNNLFLYNGSLYFPHYNSLYQFNGNTWEYSTEYNYNTELKYVCDYKGQIFATGEFYKKGKRHTIAILDKGRK